MADTSFSKLHDSIKTIALNALEASKPSGVFYGTVVSASPLKIQVEQKMTLGAEFLVVCASLQNLKSAEKVILLRVQGGQQFIVLDRVRG